MRFKVLGQLMVDGVDEAGLTRPATRRLLSLLLLDLGRAVTFDVLVDRMWGESPPQTARNSLQVHLSGLRRALPGRIVTTSDAYMMSLASEDSYDVLEFEARAEECSTRLLEGKFREASDLAGGALDLWRGTPFLELENVEAARGERDRLIEIQTATITTRAKALTLQGRVSESISLLRHLVTELPFNEALWEELVLAYYLAGRPVDALGACTEASQILGEELGVLPGPRLRELEEKVLQHDPALSNPDAMTVPHNLPGIDASLVGRGEDLAAVSSALKRNHLVTITGPPGIGKTRLATEIGSALLSRFPAGVWLVRLAGARTEQDVFATIASTMGVTGKVSGISGLFADLAARPSLLILDNCEHVLDSVRAFLAGRTQGDRLRVLATSRSRLGIGDEVAWPLHPLDVPVSTNGMWASAGLQLLVDRLGAADPTVEHRSLDPQVLVDVAQRTGGIPLAIELTARWVRSLDLASVAGHILRPVPGWVGGDPQHHVSLAAAIGWSVALLAPSDQEAFDAASVFASTFTAEAFAAVCVPQMEHGEMIDSVTRLVEASLLAPEHSPGEVRYRMLEPLKEFGVGRLTPEEAGFVRDRHARWFVDAVRDVADAAFTADEPVAYREVDETIADYRQAMRYLFDSDLSATATEIAVGLRHYWISRFLAGEGRGWLRECLDPQQDITQTSRILAAEGEIAFYVGEYDLCADRFEELRVLAVAAGDRKLEAQALHGLGLVESYRKGEFGHTFHLGAAEIFDELPDRVMAARCRTYVGMHLALAGQTARASVFLNQALVVCEEEGAVQTGASCHRFLATIAWMEDDEARARHHLERAESLASRSNDRRIIAGIGQIRALIESRWGEPTVAASSVIDMANEVSGQHGIYFAMMAYVAMPLLIQGEDWGLAARLFNHADQMYEQYGWAPIDEQNVIAREFRVVVETGVATNGLTPDLSPVPTTTIAGELVARMSEVKPLDSNRIAAAG